MRASKEARIHKAWREQVARLIALAVGKGDCEWCNGRRVDGDRDCPACGGRFDVADARSYAERLVIIGDDPAVWADLAEARGRPLAADWLRRNATRLRVKARVARRLLDTLDGKCPWAPSAAAQPSQCQRCEGEGRVTVYTQDCMVVEVPGGGPGDIRDCLDCRGTGHNLSGTLPPVEHSAHLRCKHNDSHEGAAGDDFPRTRVLSRGEHRDPCMITSARAGRESTLDERITDRGWDAEVQQPKGLPRWRRGELRHSEQRRERERQRAGATGVDYSDLRVLVEQARLAAVLVNAAAIAGIVQHANETAEQFRSRVLAYVRGR